MTNDRTDSAAKLAAGVLAGIIVLTVVAALGMLAVWALMALWGVLFG